MYINIGEKYSSIINGEHASEIKLFGAQFVQQK